MKILRCGVHGFHETIGVDVDELRVFWALHFDVEDAYQAEYRVVLSTEKEAASGNGDDDAVWDSGRVVSDAQRDILVKPSIGFASTTLHFWTVTVWDQHGNSASSAVNEFYTSYPRSSSRLLPPYSPNHTYMPHSSLIFRTWFEDAPNRWKAVWIGDGGDKPIYLRRSLVLKPGRVLSRVFIFASGLGHFNLSVNGAPASTHVVDPGWTNYHRTVQFVGYDVTEHFIRAGPGAEQVVAAHVGNGFYAGDQGNRFFWPLYEDKTYVRYGNELCFFAEVHVHYDDGSHETVVSDIDWRVRRSATTLANIYASEDHDARLYPVGWDAAGFDDSDWKPATPLTGPRGKLRYQSQPPVVLHNTFVPVSVNEVRPGVIVYDLGQNSSVMARVDARGPAGAEYRVRYSETIGEDGLVLMPDPLFKEFETGVYSQIVLAGSGLETWSPDFSFTSARYIQIEGLSLPGEDASLPAVHSVTARHISSAARVLGYVQTDKDDVNALIRACRWTFSSNLFSYHTDCPQIEKFGWQETSWLLFPATQYVRDMESLYSKILDDIVDAQEPSGLMPTMAPTMRYMTGPLHDTISWGGAGCLVPELLRQYYGSTAVFAKMYEPCARYMDYMRSRERRGGGIIEHGLGDWGRDVAFGNLQANVETAVYYGCLRAMAAMARGLERPAAEAAAWEARADAVHAAYNAALLVTDRSEHPHAYYTSLDDETGARDRTMVAQAVALGFGLVPEQHRADIVAAFVAAAEASGPVLEAGEIGLRFVWEALANPSIDRPDLALAMARRAEHPSYMRFLRRGETTLPEFWQDACRSKCHDMLGAVYGWFYAYVLGVRPAADAYRTWTLRPPFAAEFDFVCGEVDCPYGMIRVRFDRRDREPGSAAVRVTVPSGTMCTLCLPRDGSSVEVMREGDEVVARTARGREITLRQGTYELAITV